MRKNFRDSEYKEMPRNENKMAEIKAIETNIKQRIIQVTVHLKNKNSRNRKQETKGQEIMKEMSQEKKKVLELKFMSFQTDRAH